MAELAEKFDELDLAQYLDRFIEQGFDTWDTILDITETDFNILGVKLGHRRKLQRRIATARGTSNAQALASPKRKMRENLKDKLISFTEFTKIVGEKWQCLTPCEKEPYEQQSLAEKETSTIELAEYITTESYKTYSEYLLDFKAKQLHTQESNKQPPNETSKVPKLQNTPASASKPSTTLTGYCNTDIGANAQTPAWGSQARPKDIPIPEYSQQNRRNASLSGILNGPDTSLGVGQTFHSQPRSQRDKPTMDDDLTSLNPIRALLRAVDIFGIQGRLAHPQHQPA
ncbi:hypothetical protein V502_01600 [Pseudogymnoascus sp. VKM F-4520 (FW-2644)]|nr:hypothetical protein V502_01600 [Pseudogymnoascus sp. VKM F-4520 (FW-2644)]